MPTRNTIIVALYFCLNPKIAAGCLYAEIWLDCFNPNN
jgi:hypothetical protein